MAGLWPTPRNLRETMLLLLLLLVLRDCGLGASRPQKEIPRTCNSSRSGFMENHNTHLAPSFPLNVLVPIPANVVVLQGPLGPVACWGAAQPLPNVLPAGELPLLMWPVDTSDPLSTPGDSRPSHRSITRCTVPLGS
ncbi:uncharacterized protein LOC144220156 [Crocuta crocuta]